MFDRTRRTQQTLKTKTFVLELTQYNEKIDTGIFPDLGVSDDEYHYSK